MLNSLYIQTIQKHFRFHEYIVGYSGHVAMEKFSVVQDFSTPAQYLAPPVPYITMMTKIPSMNYGKDSQSRTARLNSGCLLNFYIRKTNNF